MKKHLIHSTGLKVSAGKHLILGATPVDGGVNFALYSQHAQEVYLLLFDKPDAQPSDVIHVTHCTKNIWHVFVHGIGPGQLYGYKIDGEFDPAKGLLFNPYKLLVDPYAKAIVRNDNAIDADLVGCRKVMKGKKETLISDHTDSSPYAYKSVVVSDEFDWEGDKKPEISLDRLVIYETHLKGFTAHHSARVEFPGTYLGFIEKIPYLKKLGINAVEFLPIHAFHKRTELHDKGLSEYWGYNTIAFFAPEPSYASSRLPSAAVMEFKTLVRELHKAGIEVILDVVYNHTGEMDERGPMLSLRGIDNPAYYSLWGTAHEPYRYCVNDTGCGNTVNASTPAARRLIIDSLKYWVSEMHVDGFRFDLAPVLGREGGRFTNEAEFFTTIAAEPLLKDVKFIAEPWDLAGYELSRFPAGWPEWNDKFRDTMRKFIRGDKGEVGQFATRFSGSSDIFHGKCPAKTVNFITCHDGFTLYDLFSYNHKHNLKNGEDNRDGSSDNNSCNCGTEGDTKKVSVLALRRQMAKNALSCLFLSQGIPMLLGGDEFLRTQQGNNNAYCQDNLISWFDWELALKNQDMLDFTAKLIKLRQSYPVLRRREFFRGRISGVNNVYDIKWFDDNLRIPNWNNFQSKIICAELNAAVDPQVPEHYFLFIIFNSDDLMREVRLPEHKNITWWRIIDTALSADSDFLPEGMEEKVPEQDCYNADPHSVVLLLGKFDVVS